MFFEGCIAQDIKTIYKYKFWILNKISVLISNIDNIICSWLRVQLLCTWWAHPSGDVGVVSAGHSQRFQSTTQSAPHGTLRYMTSCRRSSACFEFIDILLLTVHTAALPTPCFTDCRGCTKTADIWRWTKDSIAFILHTNFLDFPAAWAIWPKPKHNTVLWILGHMVHYVIDNRGE